MWEIRVLENTYRMVKNEPFKKEQRDTCLTGNIQTKNEAIKQLKTLYAAEEAAEAEVFHSDNVKRKRWISRDKYVVQRDYCAALGGDCYGSFDTVYLRFNRS